MGSDFKFNVFGKEYTPQQISAFILQKIKRDAEAFLGETVDRAVVTVPAYFNDRQRQVTKDAGKIAGLQVVRIINEPTAASLAYGLDKAQKDLKIMVLDFGAGSFSVTIMEMGGGVFQVKSTSGGSGIGGIDMDNVLLDYIVQEFKRQSGQDVRNDKAAMTRVLEAAENARIELSSIVNTKINLPFLVYDPVKGPIDLVMTITRTKLEELLRPIVEKCREPILQALKDAWFTSVDIDKVILNGGLSRIPIVKEFVATVMDKRPEHSIDPMDAVAAGAAIQGAIIAGDVSNDILLVDVTSLTLSTEILGGLKEPLIERNTTIPTKKSKTFTMSDNRQNTAIIHILQGENDTADDCVSLGMVNLSEIPSVPKGIPQIEVIFDIDANGILNVTTRDLFSLKEAKGVLPQHINLSNDTINTKKGNLILLEKAKYVPKNKIKENRKAIVISINDYDDNNLPDLDFCKNNGGIMYELLKSIGYEVSDNHRLVGNVRFVDMRNAIENFFQPGPGMNKKDDILLVYYSGYGIPDHNGDDIFLTSSDVNSNEPQIRGYPFIWLIKMMESSEPQRIIIVLDCYYSESVKFGRKEINEATLGRAAIEKVSRKLRRQAEGRCVLAANLGYKVAYELNQAGYSIFTRYLLEGLKGSEESTNSDGNVTPYSLSNYVSRRMSNLNARVEFQEKPIAITIQDGNIILAHYPKLIRLYEKKQINGLSILQQAIDHFMKEEYVSAIENLDKLIESKLGISACL